MDVKQKKIVNAFSLIRVMVRIFSYEEMVYPICFHLAEYEQYISHHATFQYITHVHFY